MTFRWPWQYDFPPFYTLQKAVSTRSIQVETWARLVLDYAENKKMYTLDLVEASNSELFFNSKLNRQLSTEGIKAVFEHLEVMKAIEWVDSSKTRCHVFWRRPDQWASLIYEWAVRNGFLNTPLTIYEIANGDDAVDESFYGLDKQVLLKALRSLENQKQAQLMNIGTEHEGVKFLQ